MVQRVGGPIVLAAWALGTAPVLGAMELEPVYQLRVLGGQSFLSGKKSSLSGNISGYAAPALRLGESWILLPSLLSSYQGTRQVVDLIGAGTLFQEQMDHRLGLKGVYILPDGKWRLKPSMSYKEEFLKETKDEGWGSGLFDFRKAAAGMEAEYMYRDPFSVRGSLDYYYLSFPNYTTLESRAGTDPNGAPLARELQGTHVLDSHSISMLLALGVPLARTASLEAAYSAHLQSFPEQHIVEETGVLGSPTRQDFLHRGELSLRVPQEWGDTIRLLWGMKFGGAYNASNQNSYDAQRIQFLSRFYNYSELKAQPGISIAIGDEQQPVTLDLGMTWVYRRYPYRPSRNKAGTYLAEAVHQHAWTTSAALHYPMAPHFALVFHVQYGRSSSNTQFEQAYAYDYAVTHYLFGFSYDY